MWLDMLRYLYDKVFPKENGEDYTKTEVFIKVFFVWLPLLGILTWAIIRFFKYRQ